MLDRVSVAAQVEKYYGASLDLLSELIDVGTNLEVRIANTGKGELARVIPVSFFYHRFLTLLDSIEMQLRFGQVYGARIQLRALLETSWALEWMLRVDTDQRARQFYVVDLRQRAEEHERALPGTAANQALRKALGEQADDILAFTDHEVAEIKAERDDILNLIRSLPEFRIVNDHIEQRRKNKGGELKWYQLFGGPNTIRDLAEKLGHLDEYEVFYRTDSSAVHGSCFQDQISVRENIAANLPIRSLRYFGRVADVAWTVGFRSTVMLIERFREGELRSFVRRFTPGGKSRWDPPDVEFHLEMVRPGA